MSNKVEYGKEYLHDAEYSVKRVKELIPDKELHRKLAPAEQSIREAIEHVKKRSEG